jgi:THO complex subunit 1
MHVSNACCTCRVFLPTLEEFFGEAIEQADPEGMVEDEYKYVH